MVRRAVLALSLLLLADPAWTQNIDGQAGGGAALTVKENDNIPNVSGVSSISFTNGTVTDDGTGKPAEVDVRYQEGSSIGWGGAPSASCQAFPCTIGGLKGSTTYTLQAIPFRRIAGSGSAFGPFIGPAMAKTTQVQPPPPSSTTLRGAIESGLDTCLTKKLAHTACMRALREALRKVNP